MSGMTVYVTLPGFYKEPITVPTTATIQQFCHEVHKKTGVTLFNGFGFVGQASDGTITQRYIVPTSARIVNQIPETYDTNGNRTGTADFGPTIIDNTNGTETTLADLSITHGMELKFFSVPSLSSQQTANQ